MEHGRRYVGDLAVQDRQALELVGILWERPLANTLRPGACPLEGLRPLSVRWSRLIFCLLCWGRLEALPTTACRGGLLLGLDVLKMHKVTLVKLS